MEISKYTRILVPAASYDLKSDKRLLIPFTSSEKIGFVNQEGEVVVTPKYSMCYGDCYKETDLITVLKPYPYAYLRKSGKISCYVRPVFGMINFEGEEIIPLKYFSIIPSNAGQKIFTVQNTDELYGVIDDENNIIVPFGKYHHISGFDNNFAIVSILEADEFTGDKDTPYYGLINQYGDEVLPLDYQKIISFYGKSTNTTKAILHGEEVILDLDYIRFKHEEKHYHSSNNDDYSIQDLYNLGYLDADGYEQFLGSYAHDSMGFSDEDIDDGLDGDPDAYWNID